MGNSKLTQFLGTLYKKHGMSTTYVNGYVNTLTNCTFMCAKHGEFKNRPYNVVHQGGNTNGCKLCGRENLSCKRRQKKLYGVGINDWSDLVSVSYSKKIPEYQMWKDLLKRVYSERYHEKSPTYIGVSVDERWHSMKNFISDVSKLKNYDKALYEGWALDKDIVLFGNKHYSFDTCCFVPPEINSHFKNLKKTNGLPTGVYKNVRGKYSCDVTVDKKTLYLGSFDTPKEAFLVRKKAKKDIMIRLANKWKGIVDDVVIEKMMNFDYDEDGNLMENI